MLFPENPKKIEFIDSPTGDQLVDTWKRGDYLRKITQCLKDHPQKDILQCEISNVQNTEWPSVEIYNKAIDRCSRRIENHIGIYKDPFIL